MSLVPLVPLPNSLGSYLTRMGLSKRGSLCMMEDRGYSLSSKEQSLLTMSANEIAFTSFDMAVSLRKSFGQVLSCDYEKDAHVARGAREARARETREARDARCAAEITSVIFVDRVFDLTKNKESMISSALLRQIVDESKQKYSKRSIKHVIVIIIPNKLTPDAKKTVMKLENVQILPCESLFIPVGRHRHVPRHIRLSDKEANDFEESRGISRDHLPVLLLSDPISRYYDYRPGDIIRVERPTGPFYRTVFS